MGSICLSSASILRCDSLTRNQNIYLIIPTALEVIFSTSLIFIDRGPGNRNLLFTAEGLSFLSLVVLELLSHVLPAVRGNLHLSNAIDLAIVTESACALPSHIKHITTLAFVFFILAIIICNEIAAFTSSSIPNIPVGKALKSIIAFGFPGSTSQEVWAISTSLTLVLLTVFQVAIFCFALFRLTDTLFHQRRIEGRGGDQTHPIKGIGWISGSLMLGTVETVIGFAVGGFGLVFARRILRLLTRASLCIGVAKGVPVGARIRQSQLRNLISNPRFSTFHRISHTSFHATQQVSDTEEKSATYMAPTTVGLPDVAHFANTRAQNGRQRVSIRYSQGRPMLHLRLSMLGIPTPETLFDEIKSRPQRNSSPPRPATIVKEIKSRPQSNFLQPSRSVFRDSTDSTASFYAPFELVSAPRRTLSQRSARAKLYQAVVPATSGESAVDLSRMQSTKSIPDSLQAVQDLAGQFPGPPMTFTHRNTLIIPPPTPQAIGSPSQLQSMGQPSHEGKIILSDGSEWSSKIDNSSGY